MEQELREKLALLDDDPATIEEIFDEASLCRCR